MEEQRDTTAPDEAMEVGDAKFKENIWYKKYQLLKRKCSEFEQLNDVLFSRAKKIHLMIEKAEAEKRSLMKRLAQFEVVEFPKTRRGHGRHRRSPDSLSEFDDTLPLTAARVRGELEASKAARAVPSSLSSAMNSMGMHVDTRALSGSVSVPPPLLGPFSNDLMGSGQSPMTTSLRPSSTSVTLVPVASTIPVAMTTASAAPLSSVSGSVSQTQVGGRGKKLTKKEGGAAQRGSSKKRKGDVDPNAPKKPSNAFFWFCQDKRAALQEQVKVEGLGGQHDLTKALARLWSETKTEDKKIYYEKYAMDKARYDREMMDYHKSKQIHQGGVGGARGGAIQPTTITTAPGLPRVEPLALTAAVQQTVPLLLQAGEEDHGP